MAFKKAAVGCDFWKSSCGMWAVRKAKTSLVELLWLSVRTVTILSHLHVDPAREPHMESLRPLAGNHRQNSCTRPPTGLYRIGVGAVAADRGAARHRGRRLSPWLGRAGSRPRSTMEKERGAHAAPEQGHARSKAAPVPAGTRKGGRRRRSRICGRCSRP